MGLLAGGTIGHYVGKWISFEGYKRLVSIGFIIHGGAYVIFSQMQSFGAALFFIALSRVGIAVCSVLNISQMLRHVPDEFRGRVFSTAESLQWATMMVSMAMAGAASQYYGPRSIALVAGILTSTTAIFWGWANLAGKLPEPEALGVDPKDVEIHGEPTV
jgi:MFS family permease